MSNTATRTGTELTTEALDAKIASVIANGAAHRITMGISGYRIADEFTVSIALSVHYADDLEWIEVSWEALNDPDNVEGTEMEDMWARARAELRRLYEACDSIPDGAYRSDDVVDFSIPR